MVQKGFAYSCTTIIGDSHIFLSGLTYAFLQVHSPFSIFSDFMLWWERRLEGSWFGGMPPDLALFSCSCKVSWIGEISSKHGWYLLIEKIMIREMRKTINSHMIAWQVGFGGIMWSWFWKLSHCFIQCFALLTSRRMGPFLGSSQRCWRHKKKYLLPWSMTNASKEVS